MRHADEQFAAPLPTAIALIITKAATSLATQLDGPAKASWTAQATVNAEALVVSLFAQNPTATPAQFEIFLHPLGNDIEFVLWRMDSDGRRATGWTAKLERLNKD